MRKVFFAISILILLGLIVYNQTIGNDAFYIRLNWSIDIPNSDKTVYYKGSGASFNGDGEFYTILKYNSKSKIKKINAINWENKKNETIEQSVNKILKSLNVDNDYTVDFEKSYLYFYEKLSDSSEIIIINQEKGKILYIIENIF